MIRFLFVACMLVSALPLSVSAYLVTEHVPAQQYEVQSLEGDPMDKRTLIGTLKDEPIMYEVLSDREFTLALDLRAVEVDTPPLFSVIVVRVLQPRGVEEVTRLKLIPATWEKRQDEVTGLSYLAGPAYTGVLPPGTYQIEVSTPNNEGPYMLVLGTKAGSEGYSASLRSVYALYNFYDESPVWMVRSPYVYYPLLIIMLLALVGYGAYRFRHELPFISPSTSHV